MQATIRRAAIRNDFLRQQERLRALPVITIPGTRGA